MDAEMRKKVSCHVITYNHADYISKCIDGILMQKTDFDFEIIIGDDVSTDGTREIVQRYAAEHPDLIRLNLRQKRGTGIPGKENFVSTLELCTGEYISLCDGDDYWTDPLKLQKQVDFLENHKEYSICFHDIQEIDKSGNKIDEKKSYSWETERTLTIEDLSKENFIHVPSVVFRNNFAQLPEWFSVCPIGDYPLHLLNASFGLIKYLPEPMAAYRIGSGLWSSTGLVHQIINIMFTLKILMNHFKNTVSVLENLKQQFDHHYVSIVKSFEAQNQPDLRTKDVRYLESIINFNSLLKIMKLKVIKKLKLNK